MAGLFALNHWWWLNTNSWRLNITSDQHHIFFQIDFLNHEDSERSRVLLPFFPGIFLPLKILPASIEPSEPMPRWYPEPCAADRFWSYGVWFRLGKPFALAYAGHVDHFAFRKILAFHLLAHFKDMHPPPSDFFDEALRIVVAFENGPLPVCWSVSRVCPNIRAVLPDNRRFQEFSFVIWHWG